MICRIAVHEQTPDIKDPRAHQFREWVREQPGFRAGYHVQDPETGKTISITFWQSFEALTALSGQSPPGGSMDFHPVVEMFAAVERF